MKLKTFVLSLLVLTGLAVGCSTLDKGYNVIPGKAAVPASTNAATGVVTPAQPAGAPQVEPKPAVTGFLSFLSSIPVPYAGVAGLLASTLYTGYANIRSKKLSVALVQGIDAGRQMLNTTPEGQKLDAKFKDLLIQHQDIAGVLKEASAMVNNYTADTVPPKA